MNRNIKTISAAVLTAVMCASLAGCAKKEDNGVYVDKDGNISINESKFEDHVNSVFGGDSNEPTSSTPSENSEPKEVKFAPTDEIKNAAFDSGLIQLNNEVFQQGGYITVADFVEKYKDAYDFTYKKGSDTLGTYEECKDYLIEYNEPNKYREQWDEKKLYILHLTPKSGENKSQRSIDAVIGNFTSPDEKITVDKAIVIGYRVPKLYSSGRTVQSIISEWIPKGFGLTGKLNAAGDFLYHDLPADMEMVNGDYTLKNFPEFLEQQGFTLVERNSKDYNKTYTKYKFSNSDYIDVYFVGDTNLFGKKPVYYYEITFDENTDKVKNISFSVFKFID